MSDISFPVDLRNPAQVLSCLGILEASEYFLGRSQAAFDWSDSARTRFEIAAPGPSSPLQVLLEFLSQVQVIELRPPDVEKTEEAGAAAECHEKVEVFPAASGNPMALPVRLQGREHSVSLSHWADATREDSFKLYAGNRSAYGITRAMLEGVRKPPKKNQSTGDILRKGIQQLWVEQPENLLSDPFGVVTPLGGSFNFDARRAWTAIDAGYSPNQQKTPVSASPLVELMAAWGLEYARPLEIRTRRYQYGVWGTMLPTSLARVGLTSRLPHLSQRIFEFDLALSGKDKVVNYAEERYSS